MKGIGIITKIFMVTVLLTGCYLLLADTARSHCDTAVSRWDVF